MTQTMQIENYSDYIIYLRCYNDNGENEGIGVLCGSYIITAGHVVNGYNEVRFRYRDELHILNLTETMTLCDVTYITENESGGDMALIYYGKNDSPLELEYKKLSINDKLVNISIKHQYETVKSLGELSTTIDRFSLVYNEAKIKGCLGHYYNCETQYELEGGRSGSPCLIGNKVYGILHGGTGEMSKDCYFMSSIAISDILKRENIQLNDKM